MPNADDILQCQAWGHMWEAWGPPSSYRPNGGQIEEYVRCSRCTTVRIGQFSVSTGQRVGQFKYDYPDDYKSRGGRSASRILVFQQALHVKPSSQIRRVK